MKSIKIINKLLDPRVFVVVGLLLGSLASLLPQPMIFLLAMAIGVGLGAYSIFHLIITLPFFILFEAGFIGGVALGLLPALGLIKVTALTIGLAVIFIGSMLVGLLMFMLTYSALYRIFAGR